VLIQRAAGFEAEKGIVDELEPHFGSARSAALHVFGRAHRNGRCAETCGFVAPHPQHLQAKFIEVLYHARHKLLKGSREVRTDVF
jgi:hypothetical protein